MPPLLTKITGKICVYLNFYTLALICLHNMYRVLIYLTVTTKYLITTINSIGSVVVL